MSRPLTGVNLGGWLVLEPWITPSVFAVTDAQDEYSFCLTPHAAKALRQHYRTFITANDFAWLADQGVDAVRLPVGYWLFGDQQPYLQTVSYVTQAFAWAQQYGIQILLDLHGAPGSQNGEVHSGRAGQALWHTNDEHLQATLHCLERLGDLYGKHPALLGIEVLNEPLPSIPRAMLETFYRQAYQALRARCASTVWIVCSDAFRPRRWYRRLPSSQFQQLAIDHHQYQLFGAIDRWLPAGWQLWRACHWLPGKLGRMARRHPLILGEWSAVLRADKLPSAQAAELTRAYAAAQLRAFQTSYAWFYWTYKTEGAGAWNFRALVERGDLRLP